MFEKRKWPRFACLESCHMHPGTDNAMTRPSRVLNYSYNGLLLETDMPLGAGQYVKVDVQRHRQRPHRDGKTRRASALVYDPARRIFRLLRDGHRDARRRQRRSLQLENTPLDDSQEGSQNGSTVAAIFSQSAHESLKPSSEKQVLELDVLHSYETTINSTQSPGMAMHRRLKHHLGHRLNRIWTYDKKEST